MMQFTQDQMSYMDGRYVLKEVLTVHLGNIEKKLDTIDALQKDVTSLRLSLGRWMAFGVGGLAVLNALMFLHQLGVFKF